DGDDWNLEAGPHVGLNESQLKNIRVENLPDRALAGVRDRSQLYWAIHDFRLQLWCVAVPSRFTSCSPDSQPGSPKGRYGIGDGDDGRDADLFTVWKTLRRSHESLDDADVSTTREDRAGGRFLLYGVSICWSNHR